MDASEIPASTGESVAGSPCWYPYRPASGRWPVSGADLCGAVMPRPGA